MNILKHMHSKSWFSQFAKRVAYWSGTPYSFFVAISIILIWVVTGPMFGFNDTWQLVINTGTTIITFLMVFLIQNAQNRDSIAIQIKLDELIRATQAAHNSLMDLEELEEDELAEIRRKFVMVAQKARKELRENGDFGPEFEIDKGC